MISLDKLKKYNTLSFAFVNYFLNLSIGLIKMSRGQTISKMISKGLVHKKLAFIIIIITFVTLTSALPMNLLIQNENNNLTKQINDRKNSVIPVNQNAKIQSIVNPQSSYSFSDNFSVTGIINASEYYTIKFGSWPNIIFLADQKVDVYIGVNPCASRDTSTNKLCIADPTPNGGPLSDYKLTVSSGTGYTGGVDKNNDGQDDNLGVYQTGTNYTYYYETLSYSFSVSLPDSSTFSSLNLATGSVPIYEYYGGNSTNANLQHMNLLLSSYSITVSSDANVHLDPQYPSYTIRAQNNTANINYQAYVFNPSTPIVGAEIDYNISDSNNNLICGFNSVSCSSQGFTVTETSTGITDFSGWIYFTVSFSSLGSVPEGTYKFTAIAVFINPTNPNATFNPSTYTITQNKLSTVDLIVNYNLQTPQLSAANVSNPYNLVTTMYPFLNITDLRIRPGDYFEGTVRNTIQPDQTPVGFPGGQVTYQLLDTNNNVLTLANYGTISFPNGTTSDNNGDILFNFSIKANAPIQLYKLVFTGTYAGIINTSTTWIKSTTSGNTLTYTFTTDNLYDSVNITYSKAFPSENTTLTSSLTYLTVRFQAFGIYNSTYYEYAQYYTGGPQKAYYYLYNLPVNATFVNELSSTTGISLTGGVGFNSYNSTYFMTDGNGYINFTMATQYPQIYNLTTFKLSAKADLEVLISNNQTYAYTRNSILTTNTTTNTSLSVSFNPDYIVIDMMLLSWNTTSIRPGETALYVFQAVNSTDKTPVDSVPFNYTLLIGSSTPGLIISTNNTAYPYASGYNESDANGFIYIFITSTYGVTPESTTPISISFKVLLDISLYNSSPTSPNNFFIGVNHQGYTSFASFNNTWTEFNSNPPNLEILSTYTVAKPVWVDPITDQQILDPTAGINLVRPNNQTITIRLKIENITNNATIPGFQFLVNVSFISNYQGVTLTVTNSTEFPSFNSSWFYTNTAGFIDFNLTLNYYNGMPANTVIKINATVDFSKTNCSIYCGHEERWIVGEHQVTPYNLSQDSVSTLTNPSLLLNVTRNLAYVTGLLSAESISASSIQPNNYVTLTYRAYIPQSDTNAAFDNLTISGDLPLQGIRVYLNETVLNSNGMNVTLNGKTTDNSGLVTFSVGILPGHVNQNLTIGAYADFENDQNLAVTVANDTGTFNYFWLNGTNNNVGEYLTGFSIQNYSENNTLIVRVLNAQTTITTVNRIFDTNGNLVASNPATTEVLRNYHLELLISYKDQNNVPLQGYTLTINVTTGTLSNGYIQDTFSSVIQTNSSGYILENITVKSSYLVSDAIVSAYDPNFTGPFSANGANFKIKSNLTISSVKYSIPFNSNEIFVGEIISVSGYVHDEFGQMGTNYYSSSVLGELANKIKLSAFNTTNVLITGTPITTSLTYNSTAASFTFSWQVPVSYIGQNLTLKLEIFQTGSIVHFTNSTGYLSLPLPQQTKSINVFQSVSYIFSLSGTDAQTMALNGKNINATDYTGAITINGTLYDNYGRKVWFRTVYFNYNGNPDFTATSNMNGFFSNNTFIPQLNTNTTYSFTLYYKNPYNIAINVWTNNIIRTVYDTFGPSVTPFGTDYNGSYPYQNINLQINIIDPTIVNGQYVAAVGVNTSMVIFEMNGTIINTTTNWNGVNPLSFTWDYSLLNSSYNTVNLTVITFDNVGNIGVYTIFLYVDKQAPIILDTFPNSNSTYAYQTNFILSLDTTDNSQSGLDNSSIFVVFNGNSYLMTYDSNLSKYILIHSFYGIQNNVDVYFQVTDLVGNTRTSSTFTLLADTITPTIVLTSPTANNFELSQQSFGYSFSVTDQQTGIDLNTVTLYSTNNSVVGNNGSMSITPITNGYSLTGTITKSQMDLTTSNQNFMLTIKDNNGNLKSFNLIFIIDIEGPTVTIVKTFQPKDTPATNLTTNMNYVEFDFSDSGTPTTGVNKSYAQIKLTVNDSYSVIITIQNGIITVDKSVNANDFTFELFDETHLLIGWNSTNIESYGITKDNKEHSVSIQWELISLHDNFGNNVQSSSSNSINAFMKIEALPPGPDLIGDLINLGLTFGLFIIIGIGIAYAYEKIRYVG